MSVTASSLDVNTCMLKQQSRVCFEILNSTAPSRGPLSLRLAAQVSACVKCVNYPQSALKLNIS